MEGIIFGLIIFLWIAFIINYNVAKKFESIAFQKGYSKQIHSFALCFWLGIVGYLYVIALPDLTVSHTYIKYAASAALKPILIKNSGEIQGYICPSCHEEISGAIDSCPNCHKKFSWEDEYTLS